jgi:S-adenosyl methyltransferase
MTVLAMPSGVPGGRAGGVTAGSIPPGVDPARPSPARVYDYFLGGTNYLPADRELAEKLKATVPDVVDTILANRGFHGRAAVWIASQGIRQFLDLGSGLPTQSNTHESVHRVAPGARVVYVDNDPTVAAHAGKLLAGDGTTAVILADLREPDVVLGHPDLRRLIDFSEPAGVLLTSVMHNVADGSDPWGLVSRYLAAVAPGSYLALSHGTYDKLPPRMVQEGTGTIGQANTTEQLYLRSRTEVERFFEGLELVPPHNGAPPGLTYVGLWGAENLDAADTDGSRLLYCGVARRPETLERPSAGVYR